MKKSIATGAQRGSVGALILEALSTSDKYGWEIIKEIEEKSNGEYILKEPSLYSSLKRMEVSGLITSYWQDSDIGGRRHYYNITEKGLDKVNNSKIEWSDSKQFVNELFNDEDKPKRASSINAEVKALNKTINEVQKTVNSLNKNDREINNFIKESENLEKTTNIVKSSVIEEPKKTATGIVLPTINPLQYDLFSINLQEQVKDDKNEEILEQPAPTQIIEEEQHTKLTEEFAQTQNEPKFEVKKEKYTSIPTTYVQMPLFENEKSVSLSGINIEPALNNENIGKTPIKYLKNLATEKDFLDHKHNLLNKKKNFLNKPAEYKPSFNYKTDTTLENSDSLYGSFELKENNEKEKISFNFNNLGLEETKRAKQELFEEKTEEKEEPPLPFIKEETPIFANPTKTTAKLSEPKIEDDIDYKSILGDLFSEDEEENASSIKNLPRMNVFDNVNISLKAKKAASRENDNNLLFNGVAPTYTYNYITPQNVEQQPPTNDYEDKDYQLLSKPVKELKNFNANIARDDYSNGLLDETYLSGIKVRTHKTEQKAVLMTTSYASINKLNLNLSFALFIIILIQIVATYIGLTNAHYITTANSLIFIIAAIINCFPVLLNAFTYLFNPSKKKEVNYNLVSKLSNNFIVLLITLIFIYAINLFLGMNSLNTMDFISTWLLPAVLSINLIIYPIIKFILLKRKKYYL